ncbi:glycosyl hydrolase family 17 protein [Carboxylicivirga sp. RSCT41]|uniref:glycosyl hydrolase family 17 protein n=1 Tax=Carboxylicivirga agarovorans TaxID=3417570 RepID=UPI003D32FB82
MKNHQLKVLISILILSGLTACGILSRKDKLPQYIDKDGLVAGVSKAVCYSGFRSGQHPDRGEGAVNPTYDEILEDLMILSEDNLFELIRLYDCGDNSEMVLRVIEENDIDIKVLLGIWLDAELSAHETCAWLNEPIPQEKLEQNRQKNLKEIGRGITLANQYPQTVVAVNVGNEALVDWNDHKVSPDTVIAYVKMVKERINQPVTVADNYKWWAEHGLELSEVVDFVSIHLYPVWEGKDIDEGLSFSIENVNEVRQALPESNIVITEAGWATIASEFGERASQDKQLQYYNELMTWAKDNKITTFFFEAFDEDWKGNPNNPLGAEKHWGLYTVDRQPKKVIQALKQ